MYCYFKLEYWLLTKFDALFDCFYGMIHPNVFLRYTPEQALMAYEAAITPILEKYSLKINSNRDIISVKKENTSLQKTKKLIASMKPPKNGSNKNIYDYPKEFILK